MSIILYVILLLPVLLVVFDSLVRLLFLVVAHAAGGSSAPRQSGQRQLRLLVLILAHDEQRTIERTLNLVKAQTDEDERSSIAVLADHCSDQTAALAAGLGTRVYVRSEGCAGKAQALSWFVREGGDALSATDIVTVLDADTLVEAEFCKGIRKAFGPGVEAVQSFVNPVSGDGFPFTTLVSYSELLSERIDDAARARLHWSVPLRGTGMAFRTGTFARVCEELGTQVDDIELSVRLAELGIRVHFAAEAIVNDPKSDQMMGLARQRGRWLRGQRQIWNVKQRQILKLLEAGLPNWSLIQGMLMKPKTAMVIIKVALAGIFWAWPFGETVIRTVLLGATLGSLLVDAAYYISGLRFVEHAGRYLVSLLISPMLLVLWVISWGLSMAPGKGWLRARDE